MDMVAVPGRTKELVTKTQDQNIFHHLLAQVMVNTEDFVLLPIRFKGLLELARALQILAKRFLHLDERPVGKQERFEICLGSFAPIQNMFIINLQRHGLCQF
jgi:hypothetical protein